jgi:Na+-transporting NADH:ubiquinone oxidoreductase subunit NqrA
VYFLQRHVQANPHLWTQIEDRMAELLPAALAIVGDAFIPYGDDIPFQLDVAEMITYASEQFNRRLNAVERAKALNN